MADLRLIYGFHAVTSRIRQNPEGVLEVYMQAQRQDPRMRELIKLAETNGVRVIPVEAKRLDGMAGNARHQGVAARVDAARRVQHLEDVLDTLEEPPLLWCWMACKTRIILVRVCAAPMHSACMR